MEVGGGGLRFARLSPLCLYLRSLGKQQALAGSSGSVSIMYACYRQTTLQGVERGSSQTHVSFTSSGGHRNVSWKRAGSEGAQGEIMTRTGGSDKSKPEMTA